MTDITYRDLFARHRDLRRQIAEAPSRAEAIELEVQLSTVREFRRTLHNQLIELARTERRKVLS